MNGAARKTLAAMVLCSGAVALPGYAQVTSQPLGNGEGGAGSIVTLEADAAPVSPYWLTIDRSAEDGSIVFGGYAPNESLLEALAVDIEGADTSSVEVARGASAQYNAAVEFGRQAVSRLSEGRFSLRGNMVSIKGVAASETDAAAIEELSGLLPPGLILILNEIEIAEPSADIAETRSPVAPVVVEQAFAFTASKTDGVWRFGGDVPTAQMRSFLAVRAGDGGESDVEVREGAPEGFVADIVLALDTLDMMSGGQAEFVDGDWSISGIASSSETVSAIEASLADKGWELELSQSSPSTEPAAAPDPVSDTDDAGGAEETALEGDINSDTTAESSAEAADVTSEESAENADAEPSEQMPSTDPEYAFIAEKGEDQGVELSGMVPAEQTRAYLRVVGNTETDTLAVAEGAPEGFILAAVAGVRALNALASGTLRFEDGAWALTGRAADEAARNAALAELPEANDWTVTIELPSAAEICRDELAVFSERNAILFSSGSARIAGSEGALDELVGFLSHCPELPIYVEGHTDSDGSAATNLALSVARAEAVVAALVERGVSSARLYAVGYGESAPIASNDTAAGKQRNRRIVVELEPREP
ncbi:OmpA family protein [Devosia pacifica]|nr:OmpA family protein [Devosia pacifica]